MEQLTQRRRGLENAEHNKLFALRPLLLRASA